MIFQYPGFEESYWDALREIEKRHYKTVKRYSGAAFRPSKLKIKAGVEPWNKKEMFLLFDVDSDRVVSPAELLQGVRKSFGLRLKQGELDSLCKEDITLYSEF